MTTHATQHDTDRWGSPKIDLCAYAQRTGLKDQWPVAPTDLADPLWVVGTKTRADWTALYHSTLEPQQPIDIEVAHHFLSTHPGSMLRKSPHLFSANRKR
jgi:arylamine N-acetyltransferase